MDLRLMKKSIDFSKRRKRWILLLALFGASSYGAYKAYHSPVITRRRKRLLRLVVALFSMVEAVSDSAETIAVVSKYLNEFLSSDSDEIPNILKQISKLSQSNEFSGSLSRISEAITIGVLRGYQSEAGGGSDTGSNLCDRIIHGIFSKAGTGFVSVVVGSFARNLVLGFYSDPGLAEMMPTLNGGASVSNNGNDGSLMRRWVDLICQDKPKALIANCIQVFVSTAVAVYLDKTTDVNVYNELFAVLTNPKHQAEMRDMVVSVCNGAVETFVKTSHRVLTTTKKKAEGSSCNDSSYCFSESSGQGDFFYSNGDGVTGKDREGAKMTSGWVNTVSSTFAVPVNKRFVIGMTGRVTCETLRSLVNFLLRKIFEGLRRSTNSLHNQAVGRGLKVVRYFSAKSSVMVTICLALYLHILSGTRPLAAACEIWSSLLLYSISNSSKLTHDVDEICDLRSNHPLSKSTVKILRYLSWDFVIFLCCYYCWSLLSLISCLQIHISEILSRYCECLLDL